MVLIMKEEEEKMQRAVALKRLLELSKPCEEELVEMMKSENTMDVSYMIKGSLYRKVKGLAETLKTTENILIQNIVEMKLREIALRREEIEEAIREGKIS